MGGGPAARLDRDVRRNVAWEHRGDEVFAEEAFVRAEDRGRESQSAPRPVEQPSASN